MRSRLILSTIAGLVAVSSAAFAQTGTLYSTQTVDWGSAGTPDVVPITDALTFTKFSQAGFHLTDVYISIVSNSQSSTTVHNGTGSSGTWTSAGGFINDLFASVNGTTQADLGATGVSTGFAKGSHTAKTLASGGTDSNVLGAVKLDYYSNAQIADFSKLNDFVGIGNGTLVVNAADISSTYNGNGGFTHPTTLDAYGTVTLEFYSEANPPPSSDTPEPGTMALLIAGSTVSLAAIRRRRLARK